MSMYTLIEKQLSAINEAKFQIVCNGFLYHEYKRDLVSPGTVEGKEKTRAGRPDTYLTKDGYYILAEFTTKDSADKSAFYSKLEADLDACLQFDHFNISVTQVDLIVLCCNSEVDIEMQEKLNQKAQDAGVNIRIVGLRTLVNYLYYYDKVLARDLLGIPFNTGQVLTKDQFIKQYSKKNLSTPLDNPLFGRETELHALVKTLDEKPVVVIHGPSGVGKSRLAIEAIDHFIALHSNFEAYYIFNKSDAITEDLFTFLQPDRKYVLFIDDANRQVANLLSILHLQLEKDTGLIKIIITVRDYALEDIRIHLRNPPPGIVHIGKLTDDTIEQIVASGEPTISDSLILQRIAFISKGNPRLALMGKQAYVSSNNPDVLNDVTLIYDEYFQSILDDKELLKTTSLQQVLGIISYFQTLDVESEPDQLVLADFGIALPDFMESIKKLEEMELAEVHQRYTVKLSDQVMATYFFFKVFIREKLLDFNILMQRYFDNSLQWRMRDSIGGAVAAFGETRILQEIRQSLIRYWNKLDTEVPQFGFMSVFGQYLPDQLFAFLARHISTMPNTAEVKVLKDPLDQYSILSGDQQIKLLEWFVDHYHPNYTKTAIEIGIQYIPKSSAALITFASKLTESLKVKPGDVPTFSRQITAFAVLSKYAPNHDNNWQLYNYVYKHVMLNNYLPKEVYQQHQGRWELMDAYRELKKEFWQYLKMEFDHRPSTVFEILMDYLSEIQHSNSVILAFDYLFIEDIIQTKLSRDSFAHCFFVQQYFLELQQKKLPAIDPSVALRFRTRTYEIFELINFDRDRMDASGISFYESDKFDSFVEKELSEKLPVHTLTDYKLIEAALAEICAFPIPQRYHFNPVIDALLAQLFEKDPSLGLEAIQSWIQLGNPAKIYPRLLLHTIFRHDPLWHDKIFVIIKDNTFECKSAWQERYYWFMPERFVNQEQLRRLLAYYEQTQETIEFYPRFYERFEKIDPDIYLQILAILVDRRRKDKSFRYRLGHSFFTEQKKLISRNFNLYKEAYFQREEMYPHEDREGSELLLLIAEDRQVLWEHIHFVAEKKSLLYSRDFKNLSGIWALPDAEEIIREAIETFITLRSFIWRDHAANIFFEGIKIEYKTRAIALLKALAANTTNVLLINTVLDIARNCFPAENIEIIRYFLQGNKDIAIFKQLSWYNNHFTSSGNQLWSEYKSGVLKKIYKCIAVLPDHLSYLEHSDWISQKIAEKEIEIAFDRKMQFRQWR